MPQDKSGMQCLNKLILRRNFLAGSAAAVATAQTTVPAAAETFPYHSPAQVKEMVIAAHGNVSRVRALLSLRPALANAAWEWGFGDWETALSAASHMGRREIAEMLLAHGAPPTLFSAAMLGQLEVVKAMIAARPGLERTLGPHSISLLAHARIGGEQSADVVRYLQGLTNAGGPGVQEVSEEELSRFTGDYAYGSGSNELIEIRKNGRQLTFTRRGADSRPIHYMGDRAFRPAGATAVRIHFSEDSVMTVHDGDLVIKAARR
jgi:hypothetical protein